MFAARTYTSKLQKNMTEKGKNTFTHKILHHNQSSEAKEQGFAVGNSGNSDPVKEEQNTVMMSATENHDAQFNGSTSLPVKMVTVNDNSRRSI